MSKFAALELAVDKPARMTVMHPVTGAPLCARGADGKPDPKNEAYVDVYSADSEIARAHHRRFGQRRLDALARKRRAAVQRVEELEEADIELLVELTAGWKLIGLDGAPLDVPFTKENARELYSTPAMAWLRAQVDEFAAERGNFSKTSPNS